MPLCARFSALVMRDHRLEGDEALRRRRGRALGRRNRRGCDLHALSRINGERTGGRRCVRRRASRRGAHPPPARTAAPPARPPPPPPAGSAVDHASTVLYFGPRIACSSLPLYMSFIVARPFASRTRSVNTSSIKPYFLSWIAVRSEPKKLSIGCVSPVGKPLRDLDPVRLRIQ